MQRVLSLSAMRAVLVRQFGGVEELKVESDVPVPPVAANQVSGINMFSYGGSDGPLANWWANNSSIQRHQTNDLSVMNKGSAFSHNV